MILKRIAKLVLIVAVLFSTTNLKANEGDAIRLVENFLKSIYTTLPKTKNDQEINKYFENEIPKYFAVDYISSWTLGRYVRQLNPELRDGYVNALLKYTASAYGTIFKNYYKMYDYNVQDAMSQSKNEYNVNVDIIQTIPNNGQKTALAKITTQWKVRYSPKTQQYYIVDVVFQNISFLNSQRSTFESQIKIYKDDVNAFVKDFIESQKS